MTRVLGRIWLRLLLGGVAVYAVVTVAALRTENPKLLPSVLFLGAFIAPVVFVAWIAERLPGSEIPVTALATCFLVGGLLGTAMASVLEYRVFRDLGRVPMGFVGLIEETVKLIVPLVFYVRGRPRGTAAGVLLGVASGMGFAAFETMGYGLVELRDAAFGLGPTEELLLSRSAAAPFGHGAWTGLVCGMLWRERERTGRTVPGPRVALAFAVAVVLHAQYDDWAENAVLVSLVGLASLALLLVLSRDVRRRTRPATPARPEPAPRPRPSRTPP